MNDLNKNLFVECFSDFQIVSTLWRQLSWTHFTIMNYYTYANGVKYISLGQRPRFNADTHSHAESVQQQLHIPQNKFIARLQRANSFFIPNLGCYPRLIWFALSEHICDIRKKIIAFKISEKFNINQYHLQSANYTNQTSEIFHMNQCRLQFANYAKNIILYNYANGVNYISLGQRPRFNAPKPTHAESVQQKIHISQNKFIARFQRAKSLFISDLGCYPRLIWFALLVQICDIRKKIIAFKISEKFNINQYHLQSANYTNQTSEIFHMNQCRLQFANYAKNIILYNYANGVNYISLGQRPRFNTNHITHAESVQQIKIGA